jgi:hypothetical protein
MLNFEINPIKYEHWCRIENSHPDGQVPPQGILSVKLHSYQSPSHLNKYSVVENQKYCNQSAHCVGLISPPMGPTAHWALDSRPDRDAQPVRRLVGPCRAAL